MDYWQDSLLQSVALAVHMFMGLLMQSIARECARKSASSLLSTVSFYLNSPMVKKQPFFVLLLLTPEKSYNSMMIIKCFVLWNLNQSIVWFNVLMSPPSITVLLSCSAFFGNEPWWLQWRCGLYCHHWWTQHRRESHSRKWPTHLLRSVINIHIMSSTLVCHEIVLQEAIYFFFSQ